MIRKHILVHSQYIILFVILCMWIAGTQRHIEALSIVYIIWTALVIISLRIVHAVLIGILSGSSTNTSREDKIMFDSIALISQSLIRKHKFTPIYICMVTMSVYINYTMGNITLAFVIPLIAASSYLQAVSVINSTYEIIKHLNTIVAEQQ